MNQGVLWICLSACLGAFSTTVLKDFLNRSQGQGPVALLARAIKTPAIWVAGLAFACSPVLWFLALRQVPLATAFSLLIGLQLVIVLVLARRRLGERVTVRHWVGLGWLLLASGLLLA